MTVVRILKKPGKREINRSICRRKLINHFFAKKRHFFENFGKRPLLTRFSEYVEAARVEDVALHGVHAATLQLQDGVPVHRVRALHHTRHLKGTVSRDCMLKYYKGSKQIYFSFLQCN